MPGIDLPTIMALNEVAFIKKLQLFLQEGALEGDVIPLMIHYNVPRFALQNLWPAKAKSLEQTQTRLAFAVAEDGWQGKVYNIQSRLEAVAEVGHFQLSFKKSYVIECDAMLVLTRYADDFAFCFVERNPETQVWKSRGESDVQLPTRAGGIIDHFRVRASIHLDKEEFHPITQKAYARLGMQIPLREASSLALLSLALMRRAKMDIARLESHENDLLQAREKGRLKRSDMEAARQIFTFFYDTIDAGKLEVHPFWLRAKGLFRIFTD